MWILGPLSLGSINSNRSFGVTMPIGLFSPTTTISSFRLKDPLIWFILVPLSTDTALLVISLILTSLIVLIVPTPGDFVALSLGVARILIISNAFITP